MKRASLVVVFALSVGYVLAGATGSARAQSFAGKWVHQGPRGSSFIEFFPGEKRILGPMRGTFHHSVLLDDGRLIEGDGYYTYRAIGPNRGWLTMHFADGQVTHEHEHTTTDTAITLRHHGITQVYIRRIDKGAQD